MNIKEKLTDEQVELLYTINLFKDLSNEQKAELLLGLDYSLHDIQKGEVIIEQNSACQHLHILLKGNLEVNTVDSLGNVIKVENIIAPRSFGTPHLFKEKNTFPASFNAVENSLVLKATKDSTFKLISTYPEFLKNFFQVSGSCNACTVNRLRVLSYKGIRSRFSCYLIERKNTDNIVQMNHNQTQLAEYLNVTRPALANEIRKMADEGLIELKGREVKITQAKSLLSYL